MTNVMMQGGLWGDVFCDAAVADCFAGPAFLRQMIRFEAAWTQGLADVGAVPAADAATAIAHINACPMNAAELGTAATRDGLPVPALVATLRQGQPDAIQAAIHTGSTSQDLIDTAMILTLRDVTAVMAQRMRAIIAALDQLHASQGAHVLMGRTRMQAALPITVADRINSWRGPLAARLAALADLACPVQIGGAVGLRDTPPGQGAAITASVAATLGLTPAPVWHSDRRPILDHGHWLTLTAGSLGKMGQDIALMAQQGVDEVAITGGGGSSAMPHKQNPIAAESMVTLARFVAAQQGGLAQAMVHEQERSGAAWALEWMILPAMCEATGAALTQAQTLLAQITRLGQP